MRPLIVLTCATAAVVGVIAVSASPASAACTRLGFSVNDYGKDGPTKDAKDLLDKYIAKKMTEQGITNYRVGKKDVSCELFLDFIVFDEHTCRAEATVCWEGSPLPKGDETANSAAAPASASKTAATPAKPATTTGSIEKPAEATAAEKPAAATEAATATEPAAAAEAPADAQPSGSSSP